MDLYHVAFAVLVITSGFLAWRHHRQGLKTAQPSSQAECGNVLRNHGDPKKFRNIFLLVYCLVMASDWLQGAHVYTLYKDEKQLSEVVVARLFTCGFLAAAISALFVGSLADSKGRKLACLVFCVAYAIGCLTKISNDIIILFIGRVLGGLSTTLLFSCFESWMVTEYFAQNLDKSDMTLDSMFGIMTTLNSIIAILSGVVGESLVVATGTKVSPFLAAVVCLALAFWLIMKYWGENYGDNFDSKAPNLPERSTIRLLLEDRRVLILGFVSCCFEGSMYIFVFYWSAAMKSAHAFANHITDEHDAANIPFGIIFATFMAAMMLGSLGFTYASSASISTSHIRPSYYFAPSVLLTLASAGASISLDMVPVFKSEILTFCAFCVFEACIGIYFPSIGAQRAIIVDDGVRAKIYGILRIPLNIFVVVALTTTVEGDAHRERIFVGCGGLLFLASLASAHLLSDQKPVDEKYGDPRQEIS